MKDLISKYIKVDAQKLRTGLFMIAGKDGYHAAFSFSEIMNRNDQNEFLVVSFRKDEDGGSFQIFPAADFFSDRAIKSVASLKLENVGVLK